MSVRSVCDLARVALDELPGASWVPDVDREMVDDTEAALLRLIAAANFACNLDRVTDGLREALKAVQP